MSQKTSIEWCDTTWNPIRGCSRVSPGCDHCYAERMAARFSESDGNPMKPGYEPIQGPFFGFAKRTPSGPRWTGRVELIEDKLLEPLRWRKPRLVFVNSMSDLFHEALPDEAIDRVFAVMALCHDSIFMVLTKRSERMYEYFKPGTFRDAKVANIAKRILTAVTPFRLPSEAIFNARRVAKNEPWEIVSWPLPNVRLGVSTENQKYADERIPWLMKTPAAVRFVSYEPALGPIDFKPAPLGQWPDSSHWMPNREEPDDWKYWMHRENGIDWIISGGESGPGARPAHPDWFRKVRDDCAAAGVAYFHKQNGEWSEVKEVPYNRKHLVDIFHPGDVPDTSYCQLAYCSEGGKMATLQRIGKHAAGRLLDGRIHDEFPEARP